jgi:hypothetical protein
VLTEGFGTIAMAERTFRLFQEREGREASLSGATQIRAGVIRPEVIIADETAVLDAERFVQPADNETAYTLAAGTPIRIIREPYFGELATVIALPAPLVRVGSGAEVRVLEARLNRDGATVVVPRANVEIVAG